MDRVFTEKKVRLAIREVFPKAKIRRVLGGLIVSLGVFAEFNFVHTEVSGSILTDRLTSKPKRSRGYDPCMRDYDGYMFDDPEGMFRALRAVRSQLLKNLASLHELCS